MSAPIGSIPVGALVRSNPFYAALRTSQPQLSRQA